MPRPTYANIAATLALVVAMGGTAYAATLPKNSVASKQIVNGSVKGKDVKADTLTGKQVKESTLGTVPSAAAAASADAADFATTADAADHAALAESAANADNADNADLLAGLLPTDFVRNVAPVAGPFGPSDLQLTVPGYGTFMYGCNLHSISINDDTVYFFYNVAAESYGVARAAVAANAGATVTEHLIGGIGTSIPGGATFSDAGPRLAVDLYLMTVDGTKAIHVQGIGADDTSTASCQGMLTAEILK